jgi:hypothetical protein
MDPIRRARPARRTNVPEKAGRPGRTPSRRGGSQVLHPQMTHEDDLNGEHDDVRLDAPQEGPECVGYLV